MPVNENDLGAEPTMGASLGKIKAGASDLGSAFSARREELADRLGDFMRERPFAAVGAAFGIGYLLGGGLFSRVSARLLGVGLRVGAVALARELLGGLAEPAPYTDSQE
jgi:hypothetical protein